MNEIDFDIEHQPSYASLVLNLRPNQTAIVEAGAMAAMSANIQMKSKVKGGLMKSLGRMLAGESLFLSEFTAIDQPGQLYLSPGVPGDVQHYYLSGGRTNLIVQSGGFVACGTGVEINTQFQGLKGFFSGESLFMIKATGRGDIWFSSYGGILEISVEDEYVVDTGYIVAFEDTLTYRVEAIAGLSMKGLGVAIVGGEGLVCRFSGSGRLWLQSRQLFHLINFLNPFRPVKGND